MDYLNHTNIKLNGNLDKANQAKNNPDNSQLISNIVTNESSIETSKQININKCTNCNKKLGLLPAQCKCKNMYCSMHIHKHDCTFDYKANQRKKLEENNKQVIAEKINKI